MSKGPRVSGAVKERIKLFWAEGKAKGKTLRGKEVRDAVITWAKTQKPEPFIPQERTFQLVIKEAEKDFEKVGPLPPEVELTLWCAGLPWDDDPEAHALLFRLVYLLAGTDMGEIYLPFTIRDARWALKLRGHFGATPEDLQGLILCAEAYSRRELAALVLGQKTMYTADLDAFLMFRSSQSPTWLEDYHKAVEEGVVPSYNHAISWSLAAIEHPGLLRKIREHSKQEAKK